MSRSSRYQEAKQNFSLFKDKECKNRLPYHCQTDDTYCSRMFDRIYSSFETVERLTKQMSNFNSKALEIGASPFLMPWLVAKYLSMDVTGVYYSKNTHPADGFDKIYVNTSSFIRIAKLNVNDENEKSIAHNADLVIMCEVLEHFENEPSGAIAYANKALRPGGIMYLTTPNAVRFGNILRMIFGKPIHDPYRKDLAGRHHKEYTAEEIRKLMEVSGFKILLLRGVFGRKFLNLISKWNILNAVSARYFSIIECVAEKQKFVPATEIRSNLPASIMVNARSIEL